MKRVYETCEPRAEVLSGELTGDMFAAKLDQVIAGKAPDIYHDPNVFMARTFPTEGLATLVEQVMSRVTNPSSTDAPIIRLETSFGGGKTHGLIALHHLARNAGKLKAPPPFVNEKLIPKQPVRFAGIVGTELDPTNGIRHGDIVTKTIWGEIAYQLGGPEGYAVMAKSDEAFMRPGGETWNDLLGDEPAIICIDEIAHYQRVVARKHTAADQTAPFLQTLFSVASSRPQLCVIWTLAMAGDAFAKESQKLLEDLSELAKVGGRQEIIITPTGEKEYAPVINHRLFEEIDEAAAQEVADEYSRFYVQQVERGVALPNKCVRGDYRQTLQQAYPFHQELIDILSVKTAAITQFQKTRGMLRLLAHVVRHVWDQKATDAYTIQPYHIDMAMPEIRNEMLSRLDRGEYMPAIQADVYSDHQQAHAQEIDAEWLERGKPALAGRVANTIMLHSLTVGQARGATLPQINLACGTPGLDFDYIEQTLQKLYDSCWFIDPDKSKYRFQTEPQINKIIQDEIDNVDRFQAKQELNDRIRTIYSATHFDPVIFPEDVSEVDDNAGKPKLVVMDYDTEKTAGSDAPPPALVAEMYERAGAQGKFREFRNNLIFVVADADQIEPMIDVARQYVALDNLTKPTRLGELEGPQQQVLQERMGEAELDVRVAVTRAYRHILYPSPVEGTGLAHHTLEIQDTAQAEKRQEAVILDALHELKKVILADDEPLSPKYAKDRAWRNAVEMSAADFARRFAVDRTLPIVMAPDQMKKTIRAGVDQGVWVCCQNDSVYTKSKAPATVKLNEDCMLYTPEKAKELGLLEPPEESKPKSLGDELALVCPRCGKYPCVCTTPPPPAELTCEGQPQKCFTDLADRCEANEISRLGGIIVVADEAAELRVLTVAVSQLTDLQLSITVKHELAGEFEGGAITLNYSGPWEEYTAVASFVQNYCKQLDDMELAVSLTMRFPKPVEPAGEEMMRMKEIFVNLSLGKIEMTGLPAEEEEADE